jgi:hypothetical protein
MTELERLLRQANKFCPDCGGTGIVEGWVYPGPADTWTREPDRICHCVPVMIIHAADVCQHGISLEETCEECGRWGPL